MAFLLHPDGLEMEGVKRKSTWLQNEKVTVCRRTEEMFQEAFYILLNLSDIHWPDSLELHSSSNLFPQNNTKMYFFTRI